MIGRLIDFIDFFVEIFDRLTGKGGTIIISNLSRKDFKDFKKNIARVAREAREGFQPDVWGM